MILETQKFEMICESLSAVAFINLGVIVFSRHQGLTLLVVDQSATRSDRYRSLRSGHHHRRPNLSTAGELTDRRQSPNHRLWLGRLFDQTKT